MNNNGISNSNFSIAKIILLTYVILASSYCTNLFSKSLRESIEQNRFVQHIVLLILIMTLLSIFNVTTYLNISTCPEINTIITSFIIYVWFIMTTKLDIAWNLAILVILTVYFLYENRKETEMNSIANDGNLSIDKKHELLSQYADTQKYLMMAIFGITLTGTMLYADEKQTQYGGAFDPMKFVIGN
jgi:hypothetical protein